MTTFKVSRRFHDKYMGLAKALSVTLKNLDTLFGLSKEQAMKAFQADPYLNNIPLRFWDSIAFSLIAFNRRQCVGVSLAELVCMYKLLAKVEFLGLEPDFEEG